MLRRAFTALSTLILSTLAVSATAKPVEYFQVEGVSYDQNVPAFEDRAGYEIGERPVRYDDMVGLFPVSAYGTDLRL